MSDEWNPALIKEYQGAVEAVRREIAQLETGAIKFHREEVGGPLVDVSADTLTSNRQRIRLLEAIIAAELARGMDPTPIRQIDRDAAVEYFAERSGRASRRERVEAGIDSTISRLSIDAGRGEQLWLCKSRYIGPMAGHEGLASVRNGKILRYEHLINY